VENAKVNLDLVVQWTISRISSHQENVFLSEGGGYNLDRKLNNNFNTFSGTLGKVPFRDIPKSRFIKLFLVSGKGYKKTELNMIQH
jgi:hypothetical protein